VIPAILAAPMVEGVVGGVMNGVQSLFSSPDSAPTPVSAAAFNSKLGSATAAAAPVAASSTTPTGSMRAEDWSQMSPADQKSWVQGLAGKHVDATDEAGRTISGTVGGMQMLGSTLAVNIGGHLVSLSQLKQVSWSPSVA
jgi:hypothetical protein